MTLRQQVLHGVSWNFAARLGSQFFQVAFSIALARLLSPGEFGVIGMLLVFTGFAQALADGGLSSALIYRQNIDDMHRSTVFWLQVATGTCLSLIFYCGASTIAEFYHLPLLKPLSQLMAWTFILQALGLVHSALLMKQFRFKAIAMATLGSTILAGVAAILLARLGYGVWALAWQCLISTFVLTVLLWLLSGWRPHLAFNLTAARDLGGYGIYLLGYGSLNYWLRNGTNLLVGKAIGAHGLGIFSRAYTLMLLPLNNVSTVFGQVLFPALAQLQNDIPRFRDHYMKATRLIALITFPLMVGIAALAEPLILLLLGPKWAEVIPILRILSFVGLFQSIIHPAGSVYTALGKTRTMFLLSIALGMAFLIIMLPALRLGILGITYAYAGWTLFAGLLNLHLVGRYMGSSTHAILASLAQITLIAATMGLFVAMIDNGPVHAWSFLARLVVGFLTGTSSYIMLCVIFRNEAFVDFVRLIAGRLRIQAALRWAR